MRKDDQDKKEVGIWTTEKCPRCMHFLRKSRLSKEMTCRNCGFKKQ